MGNGCMTVDYMKDMARIVQKALEEHSERQNERQGQGSLNARVH